MKYHRLILRHDDLEGPQNLANGTLYLSKSLKFVNGRLTIRKGTSLTSSFVIKESNTLKHYGRSIKDGAPGVGTGNWLRNSPSTHKDDLIYKKDFKNLIRYVSDMQAEQSGILKSTYYASDKEDIEEYELNFSEGMLGSGNRNKQFTIKITTNKDVHVRNGRDTVQDVIRKIDSIEIPVTNQTRTDDGHTNVTLGKRKVTNKELRQCFDLLDGAHYFDSKNTMYDKWEICDENKELNLKQARKTLATAIHKYVYKDRMAFADYYAKAGYGAIIDPEDYTWGYVSPIIITNPEDFTLLEIKEKY